MTLLRAAAAALAFGLGGCAAVRPAAVPESPRTVPESPRTVPVPAVEVAVQPAPAPAAVVPVRGEVPHGAAPPAEPACPAPTPAPAPSFALPTGQGTPLSEAEIRLLLEGAARMHKYRYARVGKGPAYKVDCSTFVRGLFLQLGFDTFWPKTQQKPPGFGGGVGLLRWNAALFGTYVSAEQLLAHPEAFTPQPGDVVFFHNTADRNNNRRYDDLLTHVGIVEAVDATGTVTYLHAGGHIVGRGNLALAQPRTWKNSKGDILNHYIRNPRRWDKKDSPRFAGELLAGYGRFLRPPSAPPFVAETAPLIMPTGRKFADRKKGARPQAQAVKKQKKKRTKLSGKHQP